MKTEGLLALTVPLNNLKCKKADVCQPFLSALFGVLSFVLLFKLHKCFKYAPFVLWRSLLFTTWGLVLASLAPWLCFGVLERVPVGLFFLY